MISVIGTTTLIGLFGLMSEALHPGVIRMFLANPISWEFALGLWVGLAFTQPSLVERRWPVAPVWAFPGFIMLAIAPIYVFHENSNGLPSWSRVLTWGLPAALIVGAFLSIDAAKNLFQRTMVLLGDASYALYLNHPFVMIGYGLILREPKISQVPQILIVPVIVLLAVFLGIGTHLYVERPLLRMIQRLAQRKPIVSEAS